MNVMEQFESVMSGTVNMALATSVNNAPNVRIITFGWSNENKGKIYFTSFKGNKKNEEFEKNSQVACILLPENPEVMTQVRIFGEVSKSDKSLSDVIALVRQKTSDGLEMLVGAEEMLDVYEISFYTAYVTIGMEDPHVLEIM